MSGIDDAHVGRGARGGAGSSHENSSTPSSTRSFSEREYEEDVVRAFTSVHAAEAEDKNSRREPDRTSNAGINSNSSSRSRVGLHNVKPQEEIHQSNTTNNRVYASPGDGGGDDGDRVQRSDGDRCETGSSGTNATIMGKLMRGDSEQLEEGRTRK